MIHLHKEVLDELGFKNVQNEKRQPHRKGQGEKIISVNEREDIMTALGCLKNKLLWARKMCFMPSHCR